MSIENLSDVPLYAARPPREVVPQRKAASWITVGIVHVLIFAMFLTASRFNELLVQHGSEHETMLDLSGSQDSTRAVVKEVVPRAPVGVPPELRIVPLPLPPVIETAPPIQEGGQEKGDVLGALGREIACSAGHYENLTEAQRTRCGRPPWMGAIAPNGAIVLNRPPEINRFAPPPRDYQMSGQDAQRLSVERAPTDCSFGLNMPCVNKIPGR